MCTLVKKHDYKYPQKSYNQNMEISRVFPCLYVQKYNFGNVHIIKQAGTDMYVANTYKGKYRVQQPHMFFQMTEESICQFLQSLEASGRAQGTIDEYRLALHALYRFLPEDKRIKIGTLSEWRQALQEKYRNRTINARISAANSFLLFHQRRDLQLLKQLKAEQTHLPELTRNEYLRMLQAARQLGRERVYLLIKLFACTGIAVKDIGRVTVENLTQGSIPVSGGASLRVPECLKQELLDYAAQNAVCGQIFVTRSGKPLGRTNISDSIRWVCPTACVAEEKGNPRCLRRLYQQTQDGIRQNIETLVEQAYDRMLEAEQLTAGWAKK